jgi:hypothetical protein
VIFLKTCFLFGHSDTPYSIQEKIEKAAEYHYINYGVRVFIVGSRGNFDSIAAASIKSLKKKYSDISLLLLLSYHPAERPVFLPDGFNNSYYPFEDEKVIRKFAIVKANKKMVDEADTIICYVSHGGNTRNLLEYAERRQKKEDVIIENLGQNY